MALSTDIIDAYHRSGLTQAKLAHRVGVDRTTISAWLTGKITPRGRNIAKLRQALGLEQAPPKEPDVRDEILTVFHFHISEGRLTKTERHEPIDASLAQGMTPEHLGTLTLPAGWDNMLRYSKPGDRLLLYVFSPPQSLIATLNEGRFSDGVYLVSFSGSLQLRRLQELPNRIVAILNDNDAYRDAELNVEAGDDLVLHARVLAAEGPP